MEDTEHRLVNMELRLADGGLVLLDLIAAPGEEPGMVAIPVCKQFLR